MTFSCVDINILSNLGITSTNVDTVVKDCVDDPYVCRVNVADIVLGECVCPLGSCCAEVVI